MKIALFLLPLDLLSMGRQIRWATGSVLSDNGGSVHPLSGRRAETALCFLSPETESGQ